MSNVVVLGIDAVTGQPKQVGAADTAVRSDGSSLTSGCAFGGDGSLGNVTFSGDLTSFGVLNYNNLTIPAPHTLHVTANRALHLKVRGNLTLSGTINGQTYQTAGASGAPGSGSGAGSAGGTGQSFENATASGGGGGGGSGGGGRDDGGTPAGQPGGSGGAGGTGANRVFRNYIDGAGAGAAGTGGVTSGVMGAGDGISVANPGTVGGAATAFTTAFNVVLRDIGPPAWWSELWKPGSTGAGGGGGGGGGTSGLGGTTGGTGGIGGLGGTIIVLEVAGNITITGAGKITVAGLPGGTGADGTDGSPNGTFGGSGGAGGGGGGGGGSGGTLIILYGGALSPALLSGAVFSGGAAGGAGGAGGLRGGIRADQGGVGATGGTGEPGTFQLVKVA